MRFIVVFSRGDGSSSSCIVVQPQLLLFDVSVQQSYEHKATSCQPRPRTTVPDRVLGPCGVIKGQRGSEVGRVQHHHIHPPPPPPFLSIPGPTAAPPTRCARCNCSATTRKQSVSTFPVQVDAVRQWKHLFFSSNRIYHTRLCVLFWVFFQKIQVSSLCLASARF